MKRSSSIPGKDIKVELYTKETTVEKVMPKIWTKFKVWKVKEKARIELKIKKEK